MRYLQNARKSREAWKLQVKALGWAWREQLARFTALSSNHRQMNGHRPCFIWAGLMPGLWTHWQGQINHTSFSLGLENIEERKNERAKGGWKTLPPAGWASVLFSARGMIWYYSRQKKHAKTMLRKIKNQETDTLHWKKPVIGSACDTSELKEKSTHTKPTKSTLAVHIQWNQMLVHGTFLWYLPGIPRYFKYKYIGTCYFGYIEMDKQ